MLCEDLRFLRTKEHFRGPHPPKQDHPGISQADRAARMQVRGVTIEREAISKIETGDRFVTDYELMIFAEVLGVTMDWLLGKE